MIIGPTMPAPSKSPQPPIRATQPAGSRSELNRLGNQPVLMNNAVIRPQAMKAPILGMTMLDSDVPSFCTWTRAPPR